MHLFMGINLAFYIVLFVIYNKIIINMSLITGLLLMIIMLIKIFHKEDTIINWIKKQFKIKKVKS